MMYPAKTPHRLLLVLTTALLATGAGGPAAAQPAPSVQMFPADPAPPPPGAPERGEAERERRGGEGRMEAERGERRGEMHRREHGPRHAERRGHHGGRHHGGPGAHHGFSTLWIAEKLAALETGIGIRSDQLDTWRSFTGALIAFAEASRPGSRMGGGDDEAGAGAAPQPAAPGGAAGAIPGAGVPNTPGERAGAAVPDPQFDLPALRRLDRMADRAIAAGERAEALKAAMAELQAVLTPDQIRVARELMRPMMREWRRHGREMRGRGGYNDRGRRGHDEIRGPRGGHDERQERSERRRGPDRADPGQPAPDRT